jgi:hypothetical protein
METKRMIVFLGAPTAKEVAATWGNHYPPNLDDTPSLPPFKLDSQHRTSGVTWRRLADPVESLSQELAETSMRSPVLEDPFLERSLQIFTNDGDEDEDVDMDISNASAYSDLSISQIPTPFLTGYDFDVHEITELEDLPPANVLLHSLHRKYTILVAVTEISRLQEVTTKFGKSINLVKLTVTDQTRANFEIACWDTMALHTQSMRKDDIIYFRGTFPGRDGC